MQTDHSYCSKEEQVQWKLMDRILYACVNISEIKKIVKTYHPMFFFCPAGRPKGWFEASHKWSHAVFPMDYLTTPHYFVSSTKTSISMMSDFIFILQPLCCTKLSMVLASSKLFYFNRDLHHFCKCYYLHSNFSKLHTTFPLITHAFSFSLHKQFSAIYCGT